MRAQAQALADRLPAVPWHRRRCLYVLPTLTLSAV